MMGHIGTEALGTIQDAARDEQTFTRVRAGIKADVAEKASEYIRLGCFGIITRSSIIQARIRDTGYAGEIRSIFTHHQDGVENSSGTILAAIEWMKRSDFTPLESPRFLWDDYPELGIETWVLDEYIDPKASDLSIIMLLSDVHCQLSRGRLEHVVPPLWITATMDRFPTSLNAYGFEHKQPSSQPGTPIVRFSMASQALNLSLNRNVELLVLADKHPRASSSLRLSLVYAKWFPLYLRAPAVRGIENDIGLKSTRITLSPSVNPVRACILPFFDFHTKHRVHFDTVVRFRPANNWHSKSVTSGAYGTFCAATHTCCAIETLDVSG
ncbi:hypothetical protein B0H10DRAFT_2311130 [Mycena sp. CBHHK59/15]|nr:hypothetical protein B0H10DRAFT_2311130 [Mycena sp. CBHHK59/15]